MSDLISRQALIEQLENQYINLNYENVPKSIPDFYSQMEELIKEQPTAYDTDKIVEELEELDENLDTNMWARAEDDWYGQYCNGISKGYTDAIELVKGGGISE